MRKFFTHSDTVVLMHHPRMLVETAVAQGAALEAVLAGSGIKPAMLSSPDARISYLQFGMLVDNSLRLTGNPALGIDFGRHIQPAHLGMLGVAIVNSPSARAAMEVGLRYYRMLAPAWDLTLGMRDGLAVLTACEAISFRPFNAFATEALLCAIDTQGRFLLGQPVPLSSLRLHYPMPHYAERYAEFCAAPITYDAEVTEIVFDPTWLDRPLSAPDPLTAQLAERYCESLLPSSVSVVGLLGEVRRLLHRCSGKYPGPEDLAKALQTSARSLRRGLREMGTSYQELLDEARRTHAIEYLVATEMAAEEIGTILGFSDVRSFRRAFKRWTGQTPMAYRTAEASGVVSAASA